MQAAVLGAVVVALLGPLPGLAPALTLASCDPPADHNCRMWAAVGDAIPADVIAGQLVSLDNSLENLSRSNPNGWGIAYFRLGDPAPVVLRGQPAAYLDPRFRVAAREAADVSPRLAMAHIRACSSGLCAIPNPHPFQRVKNGRTWLMAHNGTISKEVLLGLIRPEYLEANPPQYGRDCSEWIDTDLYFIYMLQTLEDSGWQVKQAIGQVIEGLRDAIPGDIELLNFVLTDGVTVWAYRQGHGLYYLYCAGEIVAPRRGPRTPRPGTAGVPYSAVASQPPGPLQDDWVALADGQIVTLTGQGAPLVENIEAYFGATQLQR